MTIDFLVGIGSQAKTQKTNSSNAYPAPEGSKIVALNGKERTIELIKINDPAALDVEIVKNEIFVKSERNKRKNDGALMLIALIVSAAVLVPIFFFAPIWVSIGFAPLFPITIMAVILKISADASSSIYWSEDKIKKLQSCRKAMENEEFRAFAKTFGEELPVDGLLKVHQLFVMQKQDKEKFEAMKFGLYCQMNGLVGKS